MSIGLVTTLLLVVSILILIAWLHEALKIQKRNRKINRVVKAEIEKAKL
jgi:hypothetical protein